MPEICRFLGIVIYMFSGDHNPPHFHVRYNEYEGIISINKIEVIKSTLPSQILKKVLIWATKYQKELEENWKLCEQGQLPKNISTIV